MNLSTLSTVLGISAVILAGMGYVGKVGGDQFWVSKDQLNPKIMEIGRQYFVSQDSFLKSELWKIQKERKALEWKEENEGLSPREDFELEQLELLEEKYLLDLQ